MRTNDYTCNRTIRRVLTLRKDAGLLDRFTLVDYVNDLGVRAQVTESHESLVAKLRAELDNWVVRLQDLVLPDTALLDTLERFECFYTVNDIWNQTHAR